MDKFNRMLISKPLHTLSLCLGLASVLSARAIGSDSQNIQKRDQNVVTFDDHSLFINGERLMIFSGEVHPFRLPVTGLWLDILQKIKASGYSVVSIYIDWFLLEGKQGEFRSKGIFAYDTFFEAAKKAGLYVIARPGPYINAEVSGGGFPGWLTRVPGALRTNSDAFISATDLYTSEIGKVIAAAQINNGGPVILLQPENEYQNAIAPYPMPEYDYWSSVTNQYKKAGVDVPYFNNEAHMYGYITAHTPASVDIYGHDSYPLGFDCDNPDVWPAGKLPTNWLATNDALAPDSPYTIPEFQGGGFQHWGQTAGFEQCASLLNMEFERVVYKNNYAVGATIFNIYMTYGGTNWGNLGHAEGFTSYDYGAQITEERQLWREKYSEVKLQAHFFHVSPAYLEADRFNSSLEYTNTDAITVTPATTNTTKFYISRHTEYETTESVPYRLKVKTVDYGDIEIPQLGDSLIMNRRDSKIHVSDYPVGDKKLIYSSAEVFTWKKYDDKTVLVLYGGPNEYHEVAIAGETEIKSEDVEVQSGDVKVQTSDKGYTILSWAISDNVKDRSVALVQGDFYIYLLNRNEAYNFWVPPTGSGTDFGTSDIILKAGYLIRTAEKDGKSLSLVGDVNATTPIEIIGGAPASLEELKFNGRSLDFDQNPHGVVTATTNVFNGTITADLPTDLLAPGSDQVITVVIDHMGLNGNYVIGEDNLKTPRGILSYSLAGHQASDRQGFHQPSPPSSSWEAGRPTDPVPAPGITFYTASFDLDLPRGYDIPLSFKFGTGVAEGKFRLQLFVNGYQFGKFVPHIGPQARYPVPEGILNHRGTNTLAITLWAMEEGGAKLEGMGWHVSMITESGFGDIELTPAPKWEERKDAY
uniref:Beta-galactosidase n=1 Tax=Bionectria ochroleuca TaxID=29856 RepID=A0A0B7JJ03_BIOOC